MSYIDILALSIAYYRHDDREIWDAEPLWMNAHYSRMRSVAKATRLASLCPSQLWWPAAQIFGDSTLGEDVTQLTAMFDDKVDTTGNSGYPARIRGFALDSVGAGVSNAEMQLFQTADDLYLRSATSTQASGQYDVGTENTVTTHYIVGYRTGPDIQGTTVNTLTGTVD